MTLSSTDISVFVNREPCNEFSPLVEFSWHFKSKLLYLPSFRKLCSLMKRV